MQSLLVCPSVTAFLYTGVTCRLSITAQLKGLYINTVISILSHLSPSLFFSLLPPLL